MGANVATNEIFISSGACDDLGDILELFDQDNTVMVIEPAYPEYVDTNILGGRKIVHLASGEDNGFLPEPDESVQADILYICSPNNPTGAVFNRLQLQAWIDFANENGAVILFDAAYEIFVEDKDLPHSIYELDGADKCAIEICSLSKTAGFTGMRCGYTVIPGELKRGGASLRALWLRRQTTKFNGVPYIVQRGAEAVFTEEGQKQIGENLEVYRRNARVLSECLDELDIRYTGGKNSPYVWMQCPGFSDSWKFFDYLLEEANVVGTPGCGFGKNGQGYFRLTAFGSEANTAEAAQRLRRLLGK